MLRCASLVLLLIAVSPLGLIADTKVTVIYYSDPPGATIYQDGQPLGVAPSRLPYKLPGRFKACTTLRPLKFRWVSGAEADISGLQACPANGRKLQFTVFRPTGIAGVEIDAQYAVALLQQRTVTSGPPAWATAFADAGQQMAAAAQLQLLQQPKHCTSTVIGNQVFTNCY